MSVALVVAVLLAVAQALVAGPAAAFEFRFSYSGPITIKIEDVTSSTLYPDPTSCSSIATCDAAAASAPVSPFGPEDSWAVFKVTSILTFPGGLTLWADGDNGEELTGILYGIQDTFVSIASDFGSIDTGGITACAACGPGGTALLGGINFDVYLDSTPDYDPFSGGPSARTGQAAYPTVTDGTLFLTATFVTGTHGGATHGNAAAAAALLHETVTTASPFTSVGSGFADVTGGSHAALFDTGGRLTFLGTFADFKVTFDTDAAAAVGICPVGVTCWTTISDDPIRGAVPQPMSVILLGVALVALAGLGYARRTG